MARKPAVVMPPPEPCSDVTPRLIRKRAPRKGPKRSLNLSLRTDLALRLELHAAEGLTRPAEIVMDLIESHLVDIA